MYCNYFGFSERPFELTPDPKFLYLSRGHIEMLASLTYGIHERRGFITIIGEVGTGKTILINTALERLDENTKVAVIFNTDMTFDQMLHMALVDLRLAKASETLSKVQALNRLNTFAIKQLPWGGNVAFIVDEAQNLDRRSMENLRLLSNLETQKHKLVQIVLSGQPELDAKLHDPQLRQLAQRISLRRYITPLNEKETYEYIRHRLNVAQYQGPSLFTGKAQKMIWHFSEGVPRNINILCDNALLIGYGLRKKRINEAIVKEAITDLRWSPYENTIDTPAAIPVEVIAPQLQARSSFHSRSFKTITLLIAAFVLLAGGIVMGTRWFHPHTVQVLPVKTTSEHNSTDQSAVTARSRTVVRGVIAQDAAVAQRAQQNITKAVVTPPQQAAKPLSQEETPMVAQKQEVTIHPGKGPQQNKKSKAAEMSGAIVTKGDNLFRIITKAYGTYNKALLTAVLHENPEIGDPDRITVGQVIWLPEIQK
jgi:general secretion pathway protein A